MIAPIIAVIATGVAAYLIGRHRNIRTTVAWKKGHALGHRAGLAAGCAERDRLRGQLADLAATGRELISAIRHSGPAEARSQRTRDGAR